MNDALEQSYRYCRRQSRQSGSSFYCTFWLLPTGQRRGLEAVYAFLRQTDDLGDNPQPIAARRSALIAWRQSLHRAWHGEFDTPLFPALVDSLRRFQIPVELLHQAIDGVEMDLEPTRYVNFDQLANYCHLVATSVGRVCLHIWGRADRESLELAGSCGLAFQLTNILRDLDDDLAQGRIYLPQEDLDRFDYSRDDLQRRVCDARFRRLVDWEVHRTAQYYTNAEALLPRLSGSARASFQAMLAVYGGWFRAIRQREGQLFGSPVRLPAWKKWSLVAGAVARSAVSSTAPVPRSAARSEPPAR